MDGRQTPARCRGFENTLVLTMRDRRVACCPCFETLASLAPQHEVVVFQQARPHPEEAANGSRECAPDDRLRAVSKDGPQYQCVIPGTSERRGRPASPTSSSSLREADCFGRA